MIRLRWITINPQKSCVRLKKNESVANKAEYMEGSVACRRAGAIKKPYTQHQAFVVLLLIVSIAEMAVLRQLARFCNHRQTNGPTDQHLFFSICISVFLFLYRYLQIMKKISWTMCFKNVIRFDMDPILNIFGAFYRLLKEKRRKKLAWSFIIAS